MPSFDFYPFLKISSYPVLSKFLHDCVDDLIGEKQLSFDNYNSDIEWTLADYEIAKESIQAFYKKCVIDNSFNLNTSDLNDSVQSAIKDCYEIRKDHILQALVEQDIINKGHNLVQNYDWKLRWVLGSSQLASLREPLLQVDLYCTKKEDEVNKKNTVSFEMNLETLNDLIEKLEKARDELSSE